MVSEVSRLLVSFSRTVSVEYSGQNLDLRGRQGCLSVK